MALQSTQTPERRRLVAVPEKAVTAEACREHILAFYPEVEDLITEWSRYGCGRDMVIGSRFLHTFFDVTEWWLKHGGEPAHPAEIWIWYLNRIGSEVDRLIVECKGGVNRCTTTGT